MIKKAVIDRFEGKQAVILVDEKPMSYPKTLLPDKAKEGDWLEVEIEGGLLISAKIDAEESARAAKRIAEKMERLRRGDHLK
jgi:hypothetical protein